MTNLNTVTLDGSKLKSIAHANQTSELTMTALAMRERNRHSTDIRRFKNYLKAEGVKIVDQDYMDFWKQLQSAGVGSIVYGRKGKPSRFMYYYSLIKIGQSALEGKDIEVPANNKAHKTAPKSAPIKAKVIRTRTKSKPVVKPSPLKSVVENLPSKGERIVYISLRDDFCAELKLPSDITQAEIKRIENVFHKLSA